MAKDADWLSASGYLEGVDDLTKIEKGPQTHAWVSQGAEVSVGQYMHAGKLRKPVVFHGSGGSRVYHEDSPFDSLAAADAAAKHWVREIAAKRPVALRLDRKTRESVAIALTLLKNRKVSLSAAIADYTKLSDMVPEGFTLIKYFTKLDNLAQKKGLLVAKKKISIKDFTAEVLADIENTHGKGKTLSDWATILNRFANDMNCNVDEIYTPAVSKWMRNLKNIKNRKGKLAGELSSKASRKKAFARVKHLFDMAVEWGYLPANANPAAGIKQIQESKGDKNREHIGIYSLDDLAITTARRHLVSTHRPSSFLSVHQRLRVVLFLSQNVPPLCTAALRR